MAGIYLHIPFCKQACHYCNFHFSTIRKNQGAVIDAMIWELKDRKDYLADQIIDSIYFGGGTPSILSPTEMKDIFETIYRTFQISKDAEVTLEANPDDLNQEKLKELHDSPVNRLSIGIQSFHNEDLEYMNRAHDSDEALSSIKNAQNQGFNNITIDLIYGTPTMGFEDWKDNIKRAIDLGIPHLSCYCLTVEPKTALHHFVKTRRVEMSMMK